MKLPKLSGNKGEWSEIYAHFRLLADGILYDGDAKCNKSKNSLSIVKIIRNENRVETTYKIVDNDILFGENNKIERKKFSEKADELYEKIKNTKSDNEKKKFSFIEIEEFMSEVAMTKLSAS